MMESIDLPDSPRRVVDSSGWTKSFVGDGDADRHRRAFPFAYATVNGAAGH